jgi:signal transduction histidine kinase
MGGHWRLDGVAIRTPLWEAGLVKPRGRSLFALALLAVCMGVAAGAIILTSRHMPQRGTWAVFDAVLGASFVGTGLYLWRQRPASHTGQLMTWVGFLFFLSPLEFSNNGYFFAVGQLTDPLLIAGLCHLILALPDGRLRRRYHRWLIGVAYGNALLGSLLATLVYDPVPDCSKCPANPLLVSAHSGLYTAIETILNLAAVTIIALIAREIVPRIARARKLERQVYGAVSYAGLGTLTAFACLFAAHGVQGPGGNILRYVAFGLFATIPFALLVGLVRGQLSRAGVVAELVESLGQTRPDGATLRDSLSAALGDDSVSLAYWIPEHQAYFGSDGKRVEPPAPNSGRASTAIERDGAPLALVIHDEALTDERDLVRAVGAAAALTLENERLSAELRAQVEEVRASRARIVRAADEERRRLERDLHDGAQQRLVAVALNLRLAQDSTDPEAMRSVIAEASEELSEATAELREFARGIHPAVLTDRGLNFAVDALASRAPVPVEIRSMPAERLPPPVESTAYFVVAEALTNVARYSHATHAEVEVGRENGSVVVEIRDDGIGGADPGRGSGLRGLADRVGAVDGRLSVSSTPGAGTIVHAEFPCAL